MNRRQFLLAGTTTVVCPVLTPVVGRSLPTPFLIDSTGAFLVGKFERLETVFGDPVWAVCWKASWTLNSGETLGTATSSKRYWVVLA